MTSPSSTPAHASAPQAQERVLSTLNRDGSRRWLRPKPSRGRFLGRRQLLGWFLIIAFAVIPYLKIAGKPVILLDIVDRQFILFGTTFLSTDTFFLMLLAISVLVGIVLLTALFGRVWCGWGCPQTVYMELLYRPLERWIEGGAARQARLDREGPDWRRVLKYVVFFVISMFIAHVFLSYFVGVDRLFRWVLGSPAQHPFAFLVMAGVTLAMFFDFAYFREQTCLVACPYGRFQSVLLDQASLIVGYDRGRGEPRGRGRRGPVEVEERGDCVDCRLCVTTCPTGIDIRDGLQMECIGCTQCIDACDEVMSKIGRPRGLVRYTSRDQLNGEVRKMLRPRVVLYSVILLSVASVFVTQLMGREGADVRVVRTPGEPFSILTSGEISNRVRVKIANRTETRATYTLEVLEPQVRLVTAQNPITVKPGETATVAGFIIADPSVFREATARIRIRVADENDFSVDEPLTLLGPWQEASPR